LWWLVSGRRLGGRPSPWGRRFFCRRRALLVGRGDAYGAQWAARRRGKKAASRRPDGWRTSYYGLMRAHPSRLYMRLGALDLLQVAQVRECWPCSFVAPSGYPRCPFGKVLVG